MTVLLSVAGVARASGGVYAVRDVDLDVAFVQLLTDLGTRPGMPAYAPSVLSYAVLLVLAVLFLPRGLLPAARGPLSRGRHAS